MEIFIFLILFVTFLLLPGFLTLNILIPGKKSINLLDSIILSFCLSLLPLSIIGFLGYIFELQYKTFIILSIATIILLIIVNIILFVLKKIELPKININISTWFTIGLLLISTVIIVLISKSEVLGDRLAHIGTMRRFSLNNYISPYYPPFKDIVNKINPAYGYNIWHLIGSTFIKYFPADPTVIWRYFVIALTPLQILAFYFLTKKIFNNKYFIIISLILYTIFTGTWAWQLAPYPDQIARNILVLVIIGLFLQYIRRINFDWNLFIAISLLSAITPLFHMFAPIYLSIVYFGFFIFGRLGHKKYNISKKSFYVLAGWIIASIPVIYYKAIAWTHTVTQDSTMGENTSSSLSVFASNIYSNSDKVIDLNASIVNPNIWLNTWTVISIIALGILLIAHYKSKKNKLDIKLLFCFVLFIMTFVISFFSPIATAVRKIITSTYMARLVLILPSITTISLFVYWFLQKKIHFLIKYSLCIVLFIALLFLPSGQRNITKQLKKIIQPANYVLDANHPIIEYINKELPNDATIAASSSISYKLYGYTDNYLATLPASHCPAIINRAARIKDIKSITGLNSGYEEAQKNIEKYKIDYILTNDNDIDNRLFGEYYTIIRKESPYTLWSTESKQ